MSPTLIEAAYLLSTGLFIFSLHWLCEPATARRGVYAGVCGMTVAVIATWCKPDVSLHLWVLIPIALAVAPGIGLSLVPLTADMKAFAERADVKRMMKLVEVDMRPEMQRECAYTVRGLPDEGLLLGAEHALRPGLYDRRVNAAARALVRRDCAWRHRAPLRPE